MASDLIRKISSEIEGRLADVRPFVVEYERLKAAIETLATVDSSAVADVAAQDGSLRTPARRPSSRSRSSARGATKRAASSSSKAAKAQRQKPRRRELSATGRAVLDALDHGSHTVSELVMVTAISAREIRSGVRRLLEDDAIVKVDRDGKAAYTLASRASANEA